MTALFEKIAAPVLTDIEIEWPDGAVREIYPQRLTDLFAGEPMLVSIRGPLPQSLTVRGRMAGSPWSQQLRTGMASELPGIGRHWAAERITGLLDNRHHRAPGDPIYDAIVATALEHGVVTRYTSLLAVDDAPARAPGQPLVQRQVPINLPAGWRAAGIGGRLPGTATQARLYLVSGLSVLLLALAAWLLGRRTLCAG
jgi:Ca-activated chloride channel family protein